MFILLMIVAAVTAYLLAGVNFAILLSVTVYHRDIRNEGSKNPGFTNFKRVFGWKYAWIVMLADLLKAAVPVLAFGLMFESQFGMWQFGTAFTGFFAMIGHCFPVWYRFRGGKAFLTGAATVFFVDWRVGLFAMGIFLLLLFGLKYMSLASMVSAAICPVAIALLGAPVYVWMISAASALLLIFRHAENISRLMKGTEKQFRLFGKT